MLKDPSNRPYVRSPLMGQLLVGHAVGTIKKALWLFAISIVLLLVALGISIHPFRHAEPIAGQHGQVALPAKLKLGVEGTYDQYPWLP